MVKQLPPFIYVLSIKHHKNTPDPVKQIHSKKKCSGREFTPELLRQTKFSKEGGIRPAWMVLVHPRQFVQAPIWIRVSLKVFRGLLYSAQNIVKKDLGRAREISLATAGTNFTKPGAHNKVDVCSSSPICGSVDIFPIFCCSMTWRDWVPFPLLFTPSFLPSFHPIVLRCQFFSVAQLVHCVFILNT